MDAGAACLCTSDKDKGDWCVTDPKVYDNGDDLQFTKDLHDHLCRVCRVFGSPWYASKVRIQDLFVADDVHADDAAEIRNGVAIDRTVSP